MTMTFFAFAGKCGERGAYGRAGLMIGPGAASKPSRPSKFVNAMEPSAVAVLDRKLRRSSKWRPLSERSSAC